MSANPAHGVSLFHLPKLSNCSKEMQGPEPRNLADRRCMRVENLLMPLRNLPYAKSNFDEEAPCQPTLRMEFNCFNCWSCPIAAKKCKGQSREIWPAGNAIRGIWVWSALARSNFTGTIEARWLARLVVRAGVELDARRERLEHAPGRCAACGEVFAAPMHVKHLRLAYRPAYGV